MDKKLFGTDGIRGIAGELPDCELALHIGKAVAVLSGESPMVLAARDTRASGDALSAALKAGLCEGGATVCDLGILPTPAVSMLVRRYGADAGVMVSASHNPPAYNGLKFFNAEGIKADDDFEAAVENLVHTKHFPPRSYGRIRDLTEAASACYISQICRAVELYAGRLPLKDLRIALDCANGAACTTAARLFRLLGATPILIGDRPSGGNINDGCGSLHVEALCEIVKKRKLDGGAAFDGDADRCIAVDETGEVLDGDRILAICALDMLEKQQLGANTIVGTTMSNSGLREFCTQYNIGFIQAPVGDRPVLETMQKTGSRLGGESAGHVIFKEFSPTGDGQLTAAMLFSIAARKDSLSKLKTVMTPYEQLLINLPSDAETKRALDDGLYDAAIDQIRRELDGGVLVRASGTENLIRILTQSRSRDAAARAAQKIVEVISR